jgi:hemoglobin
MPSLYERVGGERAVMAIVVYLYERLTKDELTSRFFVSLDIEAQTQKQIAFLSWALDGPVEYRGKDLGAAHRELVEKQGLSDEHFDRVAFHLGGALREIGVEPDVVAEVLSRVDGLRSKVLGTGPR